MPTPQTTPATGLSSKEAQARLAQYGENRLASAKKISMLKIFGGQFKDLMTMILLASTAVSLLIGETMEAAAIVVIVLMNALLGFFQEYRTEKTLEALKNMAAPLARVLRDGQLQQVPASGIVPGDVLVLEAGDKIPADARLTEAFALECDEALLTGESLPVEKKANAPVYMGTVVTKGRGQAAVLATGMNTEMGKIAGMLQEIEDDATPLQKKLAQLGKYIAAGCLGICVVVALAGVLRGYPLFAMFTTGISLAVAAVPEGLPAIVTIALALAVTRILRRNALVRRLHSVETLGCADVICTDKTGTLTENKMTVQRIFTLHGTVDTAALSGMAGSLPLPLRRLCEIAAYCSNARLPAVGANTIATGGDPTETALLVMAQKAGITPGHAFVRRDEIPFDSDRKRMTVFLDDPAGHSYSFSKGAPDILLERCRYVLTPMGVQPLTAALRGQLEQAAAHMAQDAMRVLGFAYKEAPVAHGSAEQDMIFVGLAGMLDPPRKEVYAAVAQCAKAHIRTVMITGDHKATACAVAKDIGILQPGDTVLTGAELDAMGPAGLDAAVEQASVFARVNPGHKLAIVRALKKRGHIVAMTGDGVNDAPAVKEADIGVAMGISGTDVTKSASAIVLLDDNFATFVAAVEEGRMVYSNIRKFIRYLLSCNIGEVVTMFAGMLMGLPVVLLPIQILLVNLVTDGLPALALGLEGSNPDIMKEKPRPADESVFSRGLAGTIVFRGLLIGLTTLLVFTHFMRHYGDLDTARTAALLTLVMTQLFHVFECKSETRSIFTINPLSNPSLPAAVLISLAVIALGIYHPFLQNILSTVALSGAQIGRVLLASGAVPLLSALFLLLPRRLSAAPAADKQALPLRRRRLSRI